MAIPGVNFVFTYVDYAILLIPLAVAVGSFTFKMVNSGGAIDFANQNEAITSVLLVIAPIVGFCGAILRLYARLAYYQSMLSMTLLRKNMTSNEGTISYLIHSAGKQARSTPRQRVSLLWSNCGFPVLTAHVAARSAFLPTPCKCRRPSSRSSHISLCGRDWRPPTRRSPPN